MLDLPGTPVNGVSNTVIATTSSVTVNATNDLTIFWGAYTSDFGSLFSILVPAGTGITFTYLDDVAGWVVTATSLASVYSIGNNFSTAGQMIVGSGADTATILDPGTDGQYLVADSTQPAGLNWSTPVSFRAHRTVAASSQVPPIHTFGFDTLDFDTAGGYSYSSGVSYYTIPTTGKYLVSVRLSISMAVATVLPLNQRFFISLYKGSNEISRGNDYTTGGLMGAVLNDLVPCTAGDVLSIWQYTSSVATFEVGSQVAYWSIVQVA